MDHVTLRQEKFGEIGAVLARHACNQGDLASCDQNTFSSLRQLRVVCVRAAQANIASRELTLTLTDLLRSGQCRIARLVGPALIFSLLASPIQTLT